MSSLVFGREVMYPAVMSNLLGKNNSPGRPFTMEEFQQRFTVYDEGFEHGSQLPDLLLRSARGEGGVASNCSGSGQDLRVCACVCAGSWQDLSVFVCVCREWAGSKCVCVCAGSKCVCVQGVGRV